MANLDLCTKWGQFWVGHWGKPSQTKECKQGEMEDSDKTNTWNKTLRELLCCLYRKTDHNGQDVNMKLQASQYWQSRSSLQRIRYANSIVFRMARGTKAQRGSPEPHTVMLSQTNRGEKNRFYLETGVKHLKLLPIKTCFGDGLERTTTESKWFVEKTTLNL